jgi:hypothetical protein
MLCYVMLCYVVLCYFMLCYALYAYLNHSMKPPHAHHTNVRTYRGDSRRNGLTASWSTHRAGVTAKSQRHPFSVARGKARTPLINMPE